MAQFRPFLQARIAFLGTLFTGLFLLYSCTSPCHSTHWLYHYIPEHRNDLQPNDFGRRLMWMFLGNDDDGIFGEKGPNSEGNLTCWQAATWQIRNPLHNFCFYVIGSADRTNDEWDLFKITPHGICFFHYHPLAKTVFADKRSCFYCGLHGNKPFISLRIKYFADRQLDFYAGWRERGNFGLKFNPFKKSKSIKL